MYKDKIIRRLQRVLFLLLLLNILQGTANAAINPTLFKSPRREDTIFVKGTKIPVAIGKSSARALILTPKPGPRPQINGPKVYGCRPGHPFIYRIPATGNRPMAFSVKGLPNGLKIDNKSGIITGTVSLPGTYVVTLKAENKHGNDSRIFKIICGSKLALTPPMGWNDWYAYYGGVSQKLMQKAADILISSGMADFGYQYVNIDDCWMNAENNPDHGRVGAARDTDGYILPNSYFPDMKGLTNYIHSKGMKAGIYISPGPKTCAGFTGSFGYEAKDAQRFADWGFDFLKYDYCSYENLESSLKKLNPNFTAKQLMQAPYLNMGQIMKAQQRDIVLNLCQYGRYDVWSWGAQAGESWRTGGDLGNNPKQLFDVALQNAEHGKWVGPGAWNDPDYILVGFEGNPDKEGLSELTRLSPVEQYSFMSLWCLIAAPLFYSGDLTKLNDFTLNILCNNEVIAIDQDALGKSARAVKQSDSSFILVKDMEDGSKAIGLCNKANEAATLSVTWQEAGLSITSHLVRDVWRHKNLGIFKDGYTANVPAHGVVLIKVSKYPNGK